MTFNNTEAITSLFQRLSTHLMLEFGITRATEVTTSRPEPQLFPKFFFEGRREKQEEIQPMPEQVGIPIPSLAFQISS